MLGAQRHEKDILPDPFCHALLHLIFQSLQAASQASRFLERPATSETVMLILPVWTGFQHGPTSICPSATEGEVLFTGPCGIMPKRNVSKVARMLDALWQRLIVTEHYSIFANPAFAKHALSPI